jgi:hypothetical protein
MISLQNKQSSFGSITFTTNIPGSKEFTLDPKNISYSNNLDFKPTNTNNKIFYYSDKIINREYLVSKTRSNILNILFNKNRFEKITEDNFNEPEYNQNNTKQEDNQNETVNSNVISYIEHIFTTFPKSHNITKSSDMCNNNGLKFDIPFVNIPYTYLNVNGTAHTVSRVVYYDDKKRDTVTIELLNDYSEFEKWYQDRKFEKDFTNPLIGDFNKLFNKKTNKNNLITTFGKITQESDTKFNADINQLEQRITAIKVYTDKSEETPSDIWIADKFNKRFFDEEGTLLGKGARIMSELNKVIGAVNDNDSKGQKINTAISTFKNAVENSQPKIFNSNKNKINERTNDAVNGFKILVENLDGTISGIIGDISSIPDYNGLWVKKLVIKDTEPKLNETLTVSDLEKKIKQIETKRAIFTKFNYGESGSVVISKMLSNLSDYKSKGTAESARTDEEIDAFKQAIETIFINYTLLFGFHRKPINEADITYAYNASVVISDQIRQIKKPVALSTSLFPSYKFKSVLELLDSFQTHYEIYNTFKEKMYNIDLLDSKYDKYTRYKEYVKFIKKIKKTYEYKDEFKMAEMNMMITKGELVEQRKDSGFENEYIKLHIDLIKGKVNDETVKQIACKYKDNNMVDRWNKLGVIDNNNDNNEIEPMHYFRVEDNEVKGKKQIKNNRKQTKKYRRSKRVQTRKR